MGGELENWQPSGLQGTPGETREQRTARSIPSPPVQYPASSPGWHPDPSGTPSLRYFDGTQWTHHTAPMTAPTAAPAPAANVVNVAVNTGSRSRGGTNHLLHLILTVLTAGLWLPIWIIVAVAGSRRRDPGAVINNR